MPQVKSHHTRFIQTNRYMGGKQSKLKLLLGYLNAACETYIEPFAGSLAVLINRPIVRCELANDLNHNVIRYWRQVQHNHDAVRAVTDKILHHEDEIHRAYDIMEGKIKVSDTEFAGYYLASLYLSFSGTQARQFAVAYRGFPPVGGINYFVHEHLPRIHDRIAHVQFTNKNAIHFLENCLKRLAPNDDTLMYLDPPYILDNPTNDSAYDVGGMTNDEHARMLEIVLEMCAKCKYLRVAFSGYPNPLYDEVLLGAGFTRVSFGTTCSTGNIPDRETKQEEFVRTECLWRNFNTGTGVLL